MLHDTLYELDRPLVSRSISIGLSIQLPPVKYGKNK